ALERFARRFDGLSGPIEVGPDEMRAGAAPGPAERRRALRQAARAAAPRAPPDVPRALRQAARAVAAVAYPQIPKHFDVEVVPGVRIEQRVEPLARVGCYVPAGRFPLPSSLLMTAVPARVAGVREIVVACPRPQPVVMAAALEAGVSRLFRVGGAHAIAALAYGTATIPKV